MRIDQMRIIDKVEIDKAGIDEVGTYTYLSSRGQYAVVKSPVLPVISGVPQGSVLGTWLLLIYNNEVTCVVSNGKMVVYADHIALYQIIQSANWMMGRQGNELIGNFLIPDKWH